MSNTEKKQTDISITFVAYKNYDLIRDAILSIEKKTNKNIKKQIFVVDNAAAESIGREGFISFLNGIEDAKYIDVKRNLGYGAAHNYVINRLQSKYHFILNPDILLKEDSISNIIQYMDSDDSIGMCIPKLVNESGEMQLAYRIFPTVKDMFFRRFMRHIFCDEISESTLQFMDYSKPFQVPFGQGSFLAIRTDLFKNIKGFDERFFMYLEDTDLCRRVNEVSRFMYCPYTEVIHKWNRGSHKDLKLFMIHTNSMIHYFKKWGVQWS